MIGRDLDLVSLSTSTRFLHLFLTIVRRATHEASPSPREKAYANIAILI